MEESQSKPEEEQLVLTEEEQNIIKYVRAIQGPWMIVTVQALFERTLDGLKEHIKETLAQGVAQQARALLAQNAQTREPIPPHIQAYWGELAVMDRPDGDTYTELGIHLKKLEKNWQARVEQAKAEEEEGKDGSESA